MLCEQCGKRQASVHVTKVINGKKTQSHLCADCAAVSTDFVPNVDFSNMLASLLEQPKWANVEPRPTRCPVCQSSLTDIQRNSQFGCSHCYTTFQPQVESLLRRIHGTTKHVGKIPKTGHERVRVARQIEEARTKLRVAVQEENYELAATLRDQIRELTVKLEGGR